MTSAAMAVYRINRWVELPSPFDHIGFRKAVTAMSVAAVDSRWMSSEAHLSPQQQSALLAQLRREGVLIEMRPPTVDVCVEPFFLQQPPRHRRGLLANVGVWLCAGDAAPRSRGRS